MAGTFTLRQLGQSAIGTAVSKLYTVPASTTALIKNIDICNTATTGTTIRVFLVPNAGSATTNNALIYDYSLPANSMLSWDGCQVQHTAGDTIQVQAGAVCCTAVISGVQET